METTGDTAKTPPDAAPEQVVYTLADQMRPGMLETRMQEAAAAGVEITVQRTETYAERKFREYGARTDLPEVSAENPGAFLANLSKIAAGTVRVV